MALFRVEQAGELQCIYAYDRRQAFLCELALSAITPGQDRTGDLQRVRLTS